MELIFEHEKEGATFFLNGKGIALTGIQARIMVILMRHRGKVVSREFIIREIWNDDLQGGERKKIGDSDHRLIVSIRGNKGEGGFILLRETAPAYL